MHKSLDELECRSDPPLTTELAALELLKIDMSTFSRLLLICSFINLQVTRTCLISFQAFPRQLKWKWLCLLT